jgi:flavin-dependent dehydrogenase
MASGGTDMIAESLGTGLPATVRPEEAADVVWHAIVIGGGPAGAAAAIRLARAGSRVLLVDRHGMPRPKVCGCCLSSTALAELRRLGFAPDEHGRLLGAHPLDRVRVVAAARSVTLPMPPGGTLSREALDTRLAQAAIDAGAAWLPWTDVTAITEDSPSQRLVNVTCRPQAGEQAGATLSLRAEAAVIATGLVDHVRVPGSSQRVILPHSRIGVGATLPAGAIDTPVGELMMAVGRTGYCGIVQLEDGRTDVAAAIDRRMITAAGGIAAAVVEILHAAAGHADWATPACRALTRAPFQATPPLTRSAGPVAGVSGRILRVGDSAGYVEPFTGEGMGWALAGGRLAADALLTSPSPAAAYSQAYAAFARQHHGRCRRIAAVLRHPFLVGSAIRVAAAAPWIAAPLVPMLVGSASNSGVSAR